MIGVHDFLIMFVFLDWGWDDVGCSVLVVLLVLFEGAVGGAVFVEGWWDVAVVAWWSEGGGRGERCREER